MLMYPVIVVAIVVQVGVLVSVHVVPVWNGFVLVHAGYGFVVFFRFYSAFLAYQLVY
jgi:cytochrome c oxidase assembly factor CtaG